MFKRRSLAALAVCLGSIPALGGCYPEARPVTLTSGEVVSDGGYEPAYYDGYVVYYDGDGRPFYYDGGTVVWVEPGSPYYPGLVRHYRLYAPGYVRWYGHHGYRYRTYRGAPGYHGYRPPPARHRR
ncbi:hypothetical protein BH11MYX4_BH11MYX4_15260 [soil metagenome]